MRFDPTALMGNHPLVGIINAMRNGGNPDAIAQQLLSNNPQLAKIAAGKDPAQIMRVAENMCLERGTNIDSVLKQFGITR